MAERIQIKLIYIDCDDMDDFIIYDQNGKTYLINNVEIEKINRLI